jgi:ABC-2 type transport system permease protein
MKYYLVFPLFTLCFMATIFGTGTLDSLPVGVVDHDFTSASRRVVRQVDASPSLKVTHHFVDEAEARKALQRKEVYGYLRIPYHFEEELLAGRKPTLVYAYHYALLSVGSRVSTAFRTALAGNTAPFVGVNFPQRNVNLNYAVYLAYPFFFVLLQALCLLVTIYTRRMWPYGLGFAAVSLLAHGILFGWMGIPVPGWEGTDLPLAVAVLWLWLLSVGLLVATQGLGLLIRRLSTDLSTAMSAGSMIGSLGATLCGVTFPLFAMEAPVRWLSTLFPIRWFFFLT